MKQFLILLMLPVVACSQPFSSKEISRFKQQAQNVMIVRDTWGVPHIYGKTDADAVFGLMYAQCEDDYKRVENNYLEMFGRTAEVQGEKYLYDDLVMKLIYDSVAAKNDYKKSPLWFQKLMNAFADGINYYVATHPSLKPGLIKRYEPWFALMRTDGSISATQTGGLDVSDLKSVYAISASTAMLHSNEALESQLTGSNGFAVAPSKTLSGNAILYINPHVTFYFRPEVHMVSEEGLNAYGAVTWGQFFVYQGFNEHCGWMHTSSDADVADLYEETIVQKNNKFFYRYDNNLRPVVSKKVSLAYNKDGRMERVPLTTYSTHHGPVVGSRNGKWLSLKENNRSLNALMQSWMRLKAKGFDDFEKTMQVRSNNSNNTVFADDKGNIAYWHGNFMPARNPKFNWQLPVEGSTSKTEWKGIHALNEIVHVYNPATGWIQNCNSTPYTVSGSASPKQSDFPEYMAPDAENFRAINAVKLLSNENKFTIDKMIAVGYDHYLTAFEVLLPPLIHAYDSLSAADALKSSLKEPVELLRGWDRRSSTSSVATTLAVEWGYKMLAKSDGSRNMDDMSKMAEIIAGKDRLMLLAEVVAELKENFGTWKVTWGEINRFQRRTGNINEVYNDDQPSIPSGLASSTWGSLPAFEGRRFAGSKKRYGTGGNSFVAAVEFGKTVKAKSILAGGESSDPSSKHFFDQAVPYVEGKFKEVWFYKDEVMKHVERKYHPGD